MKYIQVSDTLRLVIDGYKWGVVGVSREVRRTPPNNPGDDWAGFGSWIDIPSNKIDEFFAAVRAEAKALKKK